MNAFRVPLLPRGVIHERLQEENRDAIPNFPTQACFLFSGRFTWNIRPSHAFLMFHVEHFGGYRKIWRIGHCRKPPVIPPNIVDLAAAVPGSMFHVERSASALFQFPVFHVEHQRCRTLSTGARAFPGNNLRMAAGLC